MTRPVATLPVMQLLPRVVRRTGVWGAVVGLAVAGSLAGCSLEIGDSGKVPAEQVAQQVSDQLEARVGRAPDAVECPEDLAAEVGATLRCTLTDGDDEIGVDVEVTAVDDSDVTFDIQVDDAAQ